MASTRSSKRKLVNGSIVSMSKMDFEIARSVYNQINVSGLTDEEVSFLLGKRNTYVFGLLDPTEKDKFKTEQLDILPTILGVGIRKLIPNDIKSDENITIKGVKKISDKKVVYEFVVDGGADKGIFTKKIISGERKQINPRVHELMLKLINEGYFLEPKNALELFLQHKVELKMAFTPADLQKSIAVCCRKQGKELPLLNRGIENTRYVYFQYETINSSHIAHVVRLDTLLR
jgi:hypothetical protein